jgi:hypothetical protein
MPRRDEQRHQHIAEVVPQQQFVALEARGFLIFLFYQVKDVKLLERCYFFTCHIILGVTKLQDLPSKICQTVGVALSRVLWGHCEFGSGEASYQSLQLFVLYLFFRWDRG